MIVKEKNGQKEEDMEYRVLLGGGEKIGVIGLGMANIHTAGPAVVEETVGYALEQGVNFFDLCCGDVETFRALFRSTETLLEDVYDVTVPVAIAVRTTDARTIARHVGQVFKPSTKVAPRVLGFAQRKNGRYSLFIENGSPRLAAVDTTAHEMTHIWQYLNWKDPEILRIYRQRKPAWTRLARDIVYEGMATWSAVQLLYAMGEISYARRQELLTAARTDVYGIGFRLYRDRYDFERSGEAPAMTPFHSFPPLDPEEVRRVFDEADVAWQMGELGRVDLGGGGTVAKFVAALDADVLDVGVPVLSMHSPFEVIGKMDLYATYLGVAAFFKA